MRSPQATPAAALFALLPLLHFADSSRVLRASLQSRRGSSASPIEEIFDLPAIATVAGADTVAFGSVEASQNASGNPGLQFGAVGGAAKAPAPAKEPASAAVTRKPGELTPEGQRLLPLVWLHVPKTGSSFATTLAHFGCPKIPADVKVKEVTWKNPFNKSDIAMPFSQQYAITSWCPNAFARFESGHAPVPPWAQLEHVVTMFRDPKYRLVSGYFHNYHDCPHLRKRFFCPGENLNCNYLFRTPMWRQMERLGEYHKCTSNCQAQMLTGNNCGVTPGGKKRPSEKDLEPLALAAVDRMGFVGLTEQWPLSVCLFHARFGGTCYKASFNNVRKGRSTHRYDIFLPIVKWSLGVDRKLYTKATTRFWKEIQDYNVTHERCRVELCPEAAEFFEEGDDFDVDDETPEFEDES